MVRRCRRLEQLEEEGGRAIAGRAIAGSARQSEYRAFVSKYINTMDGKTPRERMRQVAAKWRAEKK